MAVSLKFPAVGTAVSNAAESRRAGCAPCRLCVLQLLVQQTNLLLQQVELRLLANDGLVERFDQVLGKRELGFEFIQACFHHGFPCCAVALNSGVTSFSSRE
jgi:hypothetical protein